MVFFAFKILWKSVNILKSSIPLYNFKLIASYYYNFIHFILPPRKKKYLLTSNFLYWFQLVSFHITIIAFHSTRYDLRVVFQIWNGLCINKATVFNLKEKIFQGKFVRRQDKFFEMFILCEFMIASNSCPLAKKWHRFCSFACWPPCVFCVICYNQKF